MVDIKKKLIEVGGVLKSKKGKKEGQIGEKGDI